MGSGGLRRKEGASRPAGEETAEGRTGQPAGTEAAGAGVEVRLRARRLLGQVWRLGYRQGGCRHRGCCGRGGGWA